MRSGRGRSAPARRPSGPTWPSPPMQPAHGAVDEWQQGVPGSVHQYGTRSADSRTLTHVHGWSADCAHSPPCLTVEVGPDAPASRCVRLHLGWVLGGLGSWCRWMLGKLAAWKEGERGLLCNTRLLIPACRVCTLDVFSRSLSCQCCVCDREKFRTSFLACGVGYAVALVDARCSSTLSWRVAGLGVHVMCVRGPKCRSEERSCSLARLNWAASILADTVQR